MMRITLICVVLVSIILSSIIPGECDYSSSSTSSPPRVPALYVFGDSIVDAGNNNLLLTIAKANYFPYGKNFANGPTGRFTNGKTVADFAAEYLGLPYPPPYKSIPRLLGRISLTGYNYASGSCGILPLTGLKYGLCLNLGGQIRLFGKTVRTILKPNLGNNVSQHLSKSIFVVVAGSNDYLENYSGTLSDVPSLRSDSDSQRFANLLLDSLSLKLRKLYELGARKVMVAEIGPLGCIPTVVRDFKPDGKCDEKFNQIILTYNNQLPSMLNTLTSTLQESQFIPIKFYDLAYHVTFNPATYGFSNTNTSCCVTVGEVAGTCIAGLEPCSDPNKHCFWDELHPTEASYSLIASRFINGPLQIALR